MFFLENKSTMLFVDLPLAQRLETAQTWRAIKYARAQSILHPQIQSVIEQVAGGYAIYAGDKSPLNKAVGLGMQGPVTSQDIERVEQFYRSHNTLPRIALCPLAAPSLLEMLKLGGYRVEQFYNILVCSLDNELAPLPLPPELGISQAAPEEADLWLKTTGEGFTGEENPPQEVLDILAPNFYSQDAACFFAWVEGQPAGGGAMFMHNGVVEFGGASTRPAFRKRGVQTALLHARMIAARQAGCDLAIVVTSPGTDSQRNVQRANFALAYTKPVMVKPDI